jgi:hypothetical protein
MVAPTLPSAPQGGDPLGPNDPVLVTSAGTPRSRHNLCQDVVNAVVARASRLAEGRGTQPCRSGSPEYEYRGARI